MTDARGMTLALLCSRTKESENHLDDRNRTYDVARSGIDTTPPTTQAAALTLG